MANIRNLKKDINYLTDEVIIQAYFCMDQDPKAENEEVWKVINDVVDLRNEMIARANHPDGKDNPKLVKAFYKQLYDDLFTGIAGHFETLVQLDAKN